MKLYKTKEGIVIEKESSFYFVKEASWDALVNDDGLYEKMMQITESVSPDPKGSDWLKELLAPIGNQEIWAAGVTYYRSREGRQEESAASGGGDFYARVYEAERPEIFFKA